MADFSKQWCEFNDPEMPWDFDILQVAETLEPGEYVPYICEGFGFVAIAKDLTGEVQLAINTDEKSEYYKWVPYNTLIHE